MNSGRKTRTMLAGLLLTLVGLGLIMVGLIMSLAYLAVAGVGHSADQLGLQLGQLALILLGFLGGGFAVFQGVGVLNARPSGPLRLPRPLFFGLAFALVVGLGNVLLNFDVAVLLLFPLVFLGGAALPAVAVVAWANRRLALPVTWREAGLQLLSGSTLSVVVTLLLGGILSLAVYILLLPLGIGWYPGDLLDAGGGLLERLFFSPLILVFLLVTALQAPIPEEMAKALGPLLMGRRIVNERQAFLLGMAAGAGFAILENMLYEGLYAQWNGWTWGGVTLLRAAGAVLHPLCSGIVALGLFRARGRAPGWFGRLGRAYLLAVGLHTLWNGGFQALVALTGIDFFGAGATLDIYGESVGVLLVVYLLLLAAGLWWLLHRLLRDLADDRPVIAAAQVVTQRQLALWAAACALVIVPIGAALGPAWPEIRSLFG